MAYQGKIMPRRQDSSINDILRQMNKEKNYRRKHNEPTVTDKLKAMQNDPRGKQMVEDSPIYEVRNGKEKLIKPRTGPRKSMSFSIPKQAWKEKKQ